MFVCEATVAVLLWWLQSHWMFMHIHCRAWLIARPSNPQINQWNFIPSIIHLMGSLVPSIGDLVIQSRAIYSSKLPSKSAIPIQPMQYTISQWGCPQTSIPTGGCVLVKVEICWLCCYISGCSRWLKPFAALFSLCRDHHGVSKYDYSSVSTEY